MALFDDDDDVVPELEDLSNYFFKDDDEFVSFSVLPIQLEEKQEAASSEKGIYVYGCTDKGLQFVCKHVVAWRVQLDYEIPMISVLSSEGNWIRLLRPWQAYNEIVLSVLVTVQMIHSVRRNPSENERTLSNHLCKVFKKFNTKLGVDDLHKHHSLIEYFVEKDPTLMKSKILRRLIEGTWNIIECELRNAGIEKPFIVSNGSPTSHTEEQSQSCTKDGNSDDGSDGDGTDQICAICDEGGTLLSCKGECKRAFHPKKVDGELSNCQTLGYTSREVKEIPIFMCLNCQYKIHQYFKCGELDSSHGKNAKVFQCSNVSCGHFYHPRCVAKLLEPDDADRACELEKRIMAGMPFTCPVHWCSECKLMEDRTQKQLWLAVCGRCVRSYHRKCLPREISFETKNKDVTTRAWELPKDDPKIIFIYCLDHDIDAVNKTPCRDHIKFPSAPQIERIRGIAREKINVAGIKHRDQGSAESAELLTNTIREKGDQSQEATSNSKENNLLELEYAAMNSLEDLQYEQPAGAAALISSKAVKCLEKQLGISIRMVETSKNNAHSVVNVKGKKRLGSMAEKGACPGTCEDIVRNFNDTIRSGGIIGRTIQDTNHAPFPLGANTKTLQSYEDQLDNAKQKRNFDRVGTIKVSSRTRTENKEGKTRLNNGDAIPIIDGGKDIAPDIKRHKKRKVEGTLIAMKSLMTEFYARSLEIFSELASQFEDLKHECDNLIATLESTLEMGMASGKVKKVLTLIRKRRVASEAIDDKLMQSQWEISNLYDQQLHDKLMVEHESSVEAFRRTYIDVRRLKAEVVDDIEMEELSKFRRKAENLLTTTLSSITLTWSDFNKILVGLGSKAILEPDMHYLVQICSFVADRANELAMCLPEVSI